MSGQPINQNRSSEKKCRECRVSGDVQTLLKVCACGENRAFVHIECLANTFQLHGFEKCQVCGQPYSGINVIENKVSFLNYICVKERLKRVASSLLITSFAFYTVYLGLFQFLQSRKIPKNTWNIFLSFFIIFFASLFSIFSIYSAVTLYTDYKQWLVSNKSLTIVSNDPENPIALTKIVPIRRTI